MSGTSSRLPGLHKLPLPERVRRVAEALGEDESTITSLDTGVSLDRLDELIEDVVGRFSLPLAIAPNLRVNGRDHLIPIVTEESGVVAGLSLGAGLLRHGPRGDGITAQAAEPLIVGQLFLDEVPDPVEATTRVLAAAPQLLDQANRSHERLLARGGGAKALRCRPLDTRSVLVELVVNAADAMGANLVSLMAEQIAPLAESLTGGRRLAAILTNSAEERIARAEGSVPVETLGRHGAEIATRIVRLSELSAQDAMRVVTHNKGVLNAVVGFATALAQDTRALEAAAHGYAARGGQMKPLCTWRLDEKRDTLIGEIAIPTPLGAVGGALSAHPTASRCLEIAGVTSGAELSTLTAAVGLSGNLAALRMLVTAGIGGGHMPLHLTNLARAAGAREDEIPRLVSALKARVPAKDTAPAAPLGVTVAQELLHALRQRDG